MATDDLRLSTYNLSKETISQLDKNTLLDLLEHKTRLFLAAMKMGIAESGYSKQLRTEIDAIQAEIANRVEIARRESLRKPD